LTEKEYRRLLAKARKKKRPVFSSLRLEIAAQSLEEMLEQYRGFVKRKGLKFNLKAKPLVARRAA
jgi:hypothetical protein